MSKKDFLSGYKTYDPKKEGYGNPSQWNKAFNQRMGFDEATKALGGDDPIAVLGLVGNPTWDEIKKKYHKLVMEYHPDRGGDSNKFKKVQAAYELLEEKYRG